MERTCSRDESETTGPVTTSQSSPFPEGDGSRGSYNGRIPTSVHDRRRRREAANERIGVGFIGAGNRGGYHVAIVRQLKAQGRCEPVAVCDVYRPRREAAAQKTGGKAYRRYEELLADPRVDAVCIATPDHHHAPQAIAAVRPARTFTVRNR